MTTTYFRISTFFDIATDYAKVATVIAIITDPALLGSAYDLDVGEFIFLRIFNVYVFPLVFHFRFFSKRIAISTNFLVNFLLFGIFFADFRRFSEIFRKVVEKLIFMFIVRIHKAVRLIYHVLLASS